MQKKILRVVMVSLLGCLFLLNVSMGSGFLAPQKAVAGPDGWWIHKLLHAITGEYFSIYDYEYDFHDENGIWHHAVVCHGWGFSCY